MDVMYGFVMEKHKSMVNAVGMRYLRNVCGKSRIDRVINEWVLKECGLKANSIEEWAASEEDITRRQQIVAEMETFIANEMKGAQLNVFGSSCNGFGLRKSDLDICLTFVNNQTGKTLGCVVKRFTNVCDINDASRGSLSSYAYLLMLIYFLQQCEPPVLPVLQELEKPEAPQHVIDGFETYFFEDLERLPHIWPAYGGNVSTVGELWLQFLKFYVNFDFKSNVVSIRLQEPLSCFEKLWTSKCMAIEDPFELSHNLGAHLSKKMLVYIIKTLRSAYLRFGTPHLYFMGYRNRLE
ncbi:unnamed protein product, partial [Timema podura]|nr:unnamed protein product [Timema podura]